jgi:hypothetical protein
MNVIEPKIASVPTQYEDRTLTMTTVSGAGIVKYTFDDGYVLQFDLSKKTFIEQEVGKEASVDCRVNRKNLELFKRAINDFNSDFSVCK